MGLNLDTDEQISNAFADKLGKTYTDDNKINYSRENKEKVEKFFLYR